MIEWLMGWMAIEGYSEDEEEIKDEPKTMLLKI